MELKAFNDEVFQQEKDREYLKLYLKMSKDLYLNKGLNPAPLTHIPIPQIFI